MDLSSLRFSKGDSDPSWLASLSRVDSPAPPIAVSAHKTPPAASTPPTSLPAASLPPDEKEVMLQSQQQAISLLVSEKVSLTAELERFEELLSSGFPKRMYSSSF